MVRSEDKTLIYYYNYLKSTYIPISLDCIYSGVFYKAANY